MRWRVFTFMLISLTLLACEDPGKKLVEARQEWRDTEAEVQRRAEVARQEVRDQQLKLNKAETRLREVTRKGEIEVRDAVRDLREAQTDAARAHQEAQKALRGWLHENEARVQKLRQEAQTKSAEAQDRLNRFLAPVEKNLIDARNRIMAFEEYNYPDWSDLKDSAKDSIDRVKESIGRAEKYDDPNVPAPAEMPVATPATPAEIQPIQP